MPATACTISFNLVCYFIYVLHEFCTLYLFMLLAIGLNKLFLIPEIGMDFHRPWLKHGLVSEEGCRLLGTKKHIERCFSLTK